MDASHASTGPDTGSSGKLSRGAARRSSRIKGAEKASDPGADTTIQSRTPSKPRSRRIIKKPKIGIPTKPETPEEGTKIPESDSSPMKKDCNITPEQAKTTECAKIAAETAATLGDESSTTLSASTIKPNDGLNVPNFPLNRAPSAGKKSEALGGPPMSFAYCSPYGQDQFGKYASAAPRYPNYPEVAMGAQTKPQRSSLPPITRQPSDILASHTRGTSIFYPAQGRTPSVSEYVAAEKLAPAMTHEGNRMMISPYEFVSLSNVQLTRDPLPPYPPLRPASHTLPSQLSNQSRSIASPGISVPFALGGHGDVSGVNRKDEISGTTTKTGPNFHNQCPSDYNNPTGRPASIDNPISLTRRSIGDNGGGIFKPSVAEITAIPGLDLQIQNGLPLDNLASHLVPTDSGVGLTTASEVPAVIIQLCMSACTERYFLYTALLILPEVLSSVYFRFGSPCPTHYDPKHFSSTFVFHSTPTLITIFSN